MKPEATASSNRTVARCRTCLFISATVVAYSHPSGARLSTFRTSSQTGDGVPETLDHPRSNHQKLHLLPCNAANGQSCQSWLQYCCRYSQQHGHGRPCSIWCPSMCMSIWQPSTWSLSWRTGETSNQPHAVDNVHLRSFCMGSKCWAAGLPPGWRNICSGINPANAPISAFSC